MFFDHIEKLKREYTDKYVVVDDQPPELKRFAGWTGVVKTVNMSGRALVEFNKLENIGWYDIDVDFLKIVDKPIEEQETKTATPAAATKPAPAAAKPDAGKMSVADVLAAARGGADTAKPAAKPAAEKPKMSVEEIMAAARAEKEAAPAAAPAAAVTEPAAAAEPTPAEAEPAAAEAPAAGELPTTTADIVAWCRARDSS